MASKKVSFGTFRVKRVAASKLSLADAEEPEETLPADACPGCGCRPGDGVTAGCADPGGCGTVRSWAVTA